MSKFFATTLARSLLAAAAGCSASIGAARAEEASAIPPFTGARVYVSGVPDRYGSLVGTIRDLEARSPQTYYVVVVKSSGPGEHATRVYSDRLLGAWRGEAAAKGLTLDPRRSVVVVAALDNRQVVVRPGAALVEEAGLKSDVIDREIVAPKFAPLARKGEYPEALAALLDGVDAHVRAHEAAPTARTRELAPVPPSSPEVATPPATASREVATGAATAPPAPLHQSQRRDVAWSLAGSFAAIALMIAALVWLGRRRARGALNAKLKDYKGKAVGMMDRLDGLKARLTSLPVEDRDFTEPMTGETLALYQKAQDDLRKLWDRWLEVMDVVDKAEKRGTRGAKEVAEADALVSDAKVFDEVEKGAQACSADMDRLNQAHEEAQAAAGRVAEGREQAGAKIEAVRAAGLPTLPYQPEVERLASQAEGASAILAADPIGARTILDRVRADADALVLRASDVLARLGDGKKVQEAIADLRKDVAGHRSRGLRLDEDGGNPDPSAAQADQALARLQAALEAGDPAEAARELASAQSLAAQAKGVLESVLQAKAAVEKGLPAAGRETQRLREAQPQYAAFEQELRRDFAPSTWQNVAGHLAQARALLDTFDRKADEIEQAASLGTQDYLLAQRLLGRLNLEQQAAFQLMDALGNQLAGLMGVREDAKRLADEVATRDRDARRFFQQYDHVVGSQARASLQAAVEAREKAARWTSSSPPDWTSARQALIEAREEYGIARSRAQSDLDIYQLLTNEYDEARRHAARVESFLAGHSEDRVAANQHFRQAQEVLDLVGDDSTRVGNEWPKLREQVRGARQDLDHAERLAKEDLRLARQAEAEIGEAARTGREGRTYLSMGVGLDTRPAEALLDQAQGLYHSQSYEQSIRAAAEAIQRVRQAHQWAAQQAYMRQMQIAAEERRRSVAMQNFGMGAAVGAAGAMLGRAAQDDGAAEPSPSVGDAGGSNDSADAWSSEASESTW